MPEVAVVYKSKYGSTEKYARWIAEATGAELYQATKVSLEKLLPYPVIVYCGGLYAGGILGFSLIKNNHKNLRDKKLIVVAVGATLKTDSAAIEVKEKNLPPDMQEKTAFYLLRGGLNYSKMKLIDRLLMYLLVRSIKNKRPEELDDDSKGMLATYGKTVDFTRKANILAVVDEILESLY